ncbi:MAG: tetrahydromethanopterin S-methyltransferase subunit A [Nitrosopumilus sp.]|nr:tetrahydromethanopterin S-methyltransferase subunit A [Nitrosopumilus sp.]CAI9830654.1 conserved hypothetical protein [Nitrosopumilaceae archaeon]MDA7942471.1 tetrahydromethanopterin S-methyltransferase subunit A [Nitrosopumilus sp.]MDA7952650.1 tetrahydromethanopterin S-methyltransferase subunit A [Nitrosopumilus sp.]MDA7954834.1 tetrahydromethanopterin S-methyltransferase subunit A [Nitrosopumilus sp.]
MRAYGAVGDALGAVCAAVLPVPDVMYGGDPGSRVAVCTLGSHGLLSGVGRSDVMGHVRVAARLLSENRGIDGLVRAACGMGLRGIVVCGRDVRGHMPGHSLVMLHRNGTDGAGRIIGSSSPDPRLRCDPVHVAHFRRMILEDLRGVEDLDMVRDISSRLAASLR